VIDTARTCCWAPGCSNQSISPGLRAHNGKPAAATFGGRMTGRTNRQTDGRTLDGFIDPAVRAPHAARELSLKLLSELFLGYRAVTAWCDWWFDWQQRRRGRPAWARCQLALQAWNAAAPLPVPTSPPNSWPSSRKSSTTAAIWPALDASRSPPRSVSPSHRWTTRVNCFCPFTRTAGGCRVVHGSGWPTRWVGSGRVESRFFSFGGLGWGWLGPL